MTNNTLPDKPSRYRMSYDGKFFGWNFGVSSEEAIKKAQKANPAHAPEKFAAEEVPEHQPLTEKK